MSSKWLFSREWGARAWGNGRKRVGIWARKVWRESERYGYNSSFHFYLLKFIYIFAPLIPSSTLSIRNGIFLERRGRNS